MITDKLCLSTGQTEEICFRNETMLCFLDAAVYKVLKMPNGCVKSFS